MKGSTHRAGGFLCSVLGVALLKHNGLLLQDVNVGIQWLAMYPFCMWGSVASDLDHNWQSVPVKDPPAYVLNKALHLTAPIQKGFERAGNTSDSLYKIARTFNARHRSWQTHSDLTLFFLGWLLHGVLSNAFGFNSTEALLLSLILVGVCTGMIAHFFLDMLTTEGILSVVFTVLKKASSGGKKKVKPVKVSIVPHSKFFTTDSAWETFVNKALKVCNILAMAYLLWLAFGGYLPFQITMGG